MNIRRIFKPLNKKTDTLSCSYLYADGIVACLFERIDPQLRSRSEYWRVGKCDLKLDKGRIVFHYPLLLEALISIGKARVSIDAARVENGSDKSKALRIPVGHLTVERDAFSKGGYVSFLDVSSILSSAYSLQPDQEPWDTSAEFLPVFYEPNVKTEKKEGVAQ